jgi:hypothetical protein
VWFSCQPPRRSRRVTSLQQIISAPLLAAQRQLETVDMATADSSPEILAVMNEREIYGLTGDVKKDLSNYLDDITSAGDFATM